jgi:uncharacterized protein YidB (DUF937 family)
MGLMDMIGGLLGQQQGGSQSSGMGQVLTQLLAGGNDTQGGGLGGLVNQFRQAGLGHVADSWVSRGPNQPVTPGQLRQVFGNEQVEDMADQAGMPQNDFLNQLSQHLPNAVDQATPNGEIPEDGEMPGGGTISV